MDDIAEQIARRDRLMRKLSFERTHAERMAAMAELQKRAWKTLRQNPAGYAHFIRRNFKARATSWTESHDG